MVIDAAKGIEAQTRKLFEVCRLRDSPDHHLHQQGRPRGAATRSTLLDEVAEALALDVCADDLAHRHGRRFSQASYDLATNIACATATAEGDSRECLGNARSQVDGAIAADIAEEIELAQMALCPSSISTAYRDGDLTPVYFGSRASRTSASRELIDGHRPLRPRRAPQPADSRAIEPTEPEVTGFVFKVQANMDPTHRDRIAFMRIVLGQLQARHEAHAGRARASPSRCTRRSCSSRRTARSPMSAYAGDIIGIPNHGTLRVGDTLPEKDAVRFTGLPNFAPEILRRVQLKDPTKTKQLQEGAR
jgi:peptide chain release factor 3